MAFLIKNRQKRKVGYSFIEEQLNLPMMKTRKPAIEDITIGRITQGDQADLYPTKTVPNDNSILSHLFFAIKNEPIDLFVLSFALKTIDKADIKSKILNAPQSLQSRILGYFWEIFNHDEIDVDHSKATYSKIFDETKYITGITRKNSKWRINFNGIGDIDWCPTILKTQYITQLLEKDLLKSTKALFQQRNPDIVDRAISWLYLSETKSSFAIEREKPTHDKTKLFAQLLSSIDKSQRLTEDRLVELQNKIVTNALDQACLFRHEQNWLQNNGWNTSASVTYVPPEPALARNLMLALMKFFNEESDTIDPIIRAAIVSFAFVYHHPFMDGNGRLSRYLIHQSMASSTNLTNGIILPISVAIAEHEPDYLTALTTFSKPARQLCQVTFLDQDIFDFNWSEQAENAFKYPDYTKQTEFILAMAEHALNVNLKKELAFLEAFDYVFHRVNSRYDVKNPILNELIFSAINDNGVVSKNKRKKFPFIKEAVFEAIEESIKEESDQQQNVQLYGTVVDCDDSGFTLKNRTGQLFDIPLADHHHQIGDKLSVLIDKDKKVTIEKIITIV